MNNSGALDHDDAMGIAGRLSAAGRMAILAGLVVLIMAGLVLTAIGWIDSHEPIQSGTFTAQDCQPRPRGGCIYVGRWVRDDGRVTIEDVRLDGDIGADGTTIASYRPAGIINDRDNRIVHSGSWVEGARWVPLMISAIAAVPLAFEMNEYRSRAGTRCRSKVEPKSFE
ncbi:MAG: hypothetical protein RI885_174 [Actinomycetota bacterium]